MNPLSLFGLNRAFFLSIISYALVTVGNYFKGKDQNTTGADDLVGDLLVAASPAVEAVLNGDVKGNAVSRSMQIISRITNEYLTANPPPDAAAPVNVAVNINQ